MSEQKVDVQLRISPEAYDVLMQYAPSPRKRGEWLSELLENYEPNRESGAGVLERIERKIDSLLHDCDHIAATPTVIK